MKNRLAIILTFICLVLISGCGLKKEPIKFNQALAVAEADKYQVIDIMDQYEGQDLFTSAVIITDPSTGWEIEFYEVKNEKGAKDIFKQNKKIFKANNDFGTVKEASTKGNNYATYKYINLGTFNYISRIDNFVVFVSQSTDFQEAIENYLFEIGY